MGGTIVPTIFLLQDVSASRVVRIYACIIFRNTRIVCGLFYNQTLQLSQKT